MKKALTALLIIILIVMTSCRSSYDEKTERTAQLPAEVSEFEAAEAEEADAVQEAVDKCSAEAEDYNNTVCISKEIERLYKEGYKVVDELCSKTEMEETCRFFSAYNFQKKEYCTGTEVETACKLVSDRFFCNSMDNELNCLANKALMIRFVDRKEAMKICEYVNSRGYAPGEDDVSCEDIDFEAGELDSDPYYDRLFVMYVFALLADYEVNTYYEYR